MKLRTSDIVIKLPERPQIWEKKAAEELRDYLKKLPVRHRAWHEAGVLHWRHGGCPVGRLFVKTMAEEEWVVKTLPDGGIIFCGGGTAENPLQRLLLSGEPCGSALVYSDRRIPAQGKTP